MVGERDPYAVLLGKHVQIVLRNGDRYAGLLAEKSYSFVTLAENGGTCVLRREDVSVIRSTDGPDPPAGASLRPHGQTEARTVKTIT